MINNDISRKYLKQIKDIFPIFSAQERKFIQYMEANISEFLDVNSSAAYENLCEEFGRPVDVVFDYISALDSETIISKISYRKMIRRTIACLLAFVVALFGVLCTTSYMMYLDEINPVFTIQGEIDQ